VRSFRLGLGELIVSQHVVVIGGGVIGLCTAWYAAQRGLRVTIVERGGPMRSGCSFGNAGMIVPSHIVPLAAPGMVATALRMMWNRESPFYVKPRWSADLLRWGYRFWRSATAKHVARSAPLLRDLHLASRALYEELADGCNNDFDLIRAGLLVLCKTERALAEEAHLVTLAHAHGMPAEVVDAAAIAALDPQVRYDVLGGAYFPKDGHLSPDRFMASLQSWLQQRDTVRFAWHTGVNALRLSGRRIEAVATTAGDLPCDEVVLCSGVWSAGLAQGLGLSLPLQAGKGYSLTLDQPRRLPRLCAIAAEARLAITPMGTRLRVGGTMEFAGLDERITGSRVRGIVRSFAKYYPEFQEADFAGVQPWSGLRPCSPDGLPYLGRPARFDNLVIAAGHAMLGLSLGPITGKLATQLICHESPEIELQLLSPDRFEA
jgi:D-amino-acid dehydrogenase